MDRQEPHYKNRDDKQRMMGVSLKLTLGPGNQFMHQARGVERGSRFKYDADTSTSRIERLHVVRRVLVVASMVFVPGRELEQSTVKLSDVILGKGNIPPRIEHQFRRLRVSGNLLFIPRPKRSQIQVREKEVYLSIREPRSFDSR
jgi:hypothetical protein